MNTVVSDSNNVSEQSKEEYEKILAAFHRLIDIYENSAERLEVIEDIITLRASFLIDHAIRGLNIDFDKALLLLRNFNDSLTEREKQERDILVVAIDNLIDFAAAQEYQMLKEIPKEPEKESYLYDSICEKYNLTYASQENNDVLYAAMMAAWWLNVSEESLITFMTQGDERVRPWHLSYEGLSYLKRDFPPELIPPIEWRCRCYLITNGFASVYGNADKKSKEIKVNPVFSESLAKGGRIFSKSHPYFKNEIPKEIQEIKLRIKRKLYL